MAVRTSTGSHGPGRTLSGGIRQGNLIRKGSHLAYSLLRSFTCYGHLWPIGCGLIGDLPPKGRICAFDAFGIVTIVTQCGTYCHQHFN